MANLTIDKSKLDISQIFLCFMSLVGDVDKTAHALDIDPAVVASLAESEGWLEKVRRISVMSKSGKPGDFERAQNRALNFVQAHRLRMTLSALLSTFDGLTPAEVMERVSTIDKHGFSHLSSRFFSDLAAGMEKTQAMTYAALGDSVKERVDRSEEEGGAMSANNMHAAVIAALNAPHAPILTGQALDEETMRLLPSAHREQKALVVSEDADPNI